MYTFKRNPAILIAANEHKFQFLFDQHLSTERGHINIINQKIQNLVFLLLLSYIDCQEIC